MWSLLVESLFDLGVVILCLGQTAILLVTVISAVELVVVSIVALILVVTHIPFSAACTLSKNERALVTSLMHKAADRHRKNNAKNALHIYTRILELDPQHHLTHYYRNILHQSQQKKSSARNDFQLALDPRI